MVIAIVVGLILVAIVMTQLRLFGSIAQVLHPAQDNFVFSVLLTQSLVSIFLTFRILLSRQAKKSETPSN